MFRSRSASLSPSRKALRALLVAAGVAAFAPLSEAATYTWQISGSNKNWSTNPADTNWFVDSAGPLAPWVDGNDAVLSAAAETVSLIGIVTPSSVAITTSGALTLQGSGSIAGTGGLTKAGSGLVVINTVNTYSGTTAINAGTLALGVDNAIANSAVSMTGNGTILNMGATQQTFQGLDARLAAAGTLNVIGTGTLTVAGGDFYAGTSVSATYIGTVRLNNLSHFVYNNPAGVFYVGSTTSAASGQNPRGELYLSPDSQITAASLNVQTQGDGGAYNTTNAGTGFLYLGQNTSLTVGSINVGTSGRGRGSIVYPSGTTNPVLTIRGLGEDGRADITQGSHSSTGGISPQDVVIDLVSNVTGVSTLDAMVNTLMISSYTRGGSSGGQVQNAIFAMGAGVLDATTILLGNTFFDSETQNNATVNATLSVTGGTIKVGTLTIGTHAQGNRILNATLNLLGDATLLAETIEAGVEQGNPASTTRTFNWNSATIKNYDENTDLEIGAGLTLTTVAAGTHTFDISSGRVGLVHATVAGPAQITKTGAGNLYLGGTNTFTGGIVVNAGVLELASVSALGTGNAVVNSGAGVGLLGDWTTNISRLQLAPGFNLQVGTSLDAPGNLHLASLNMAGTVLFDLNRGSGAYGVNDSILVDGALTLDPGAKLDINFHGNLPANPLAVRTYNLFIYGAGSQIPDNVTLTNMLPEKLLGERSVYTIVDAGTAIQLNATGQPYDLTWTGGQSGVWRTTFDKSATPLLNWLNEDNAPDQFFNADTVTFDSAGQGRQEVRVSGSVYPETWTVNVGAGESYTFMSNSGNLTLDKITGETGLVKTGAGEMTILMNNDFTGAVSIQGGTVRVGNGILADATLGGTGDITVSPGAQLAYNMPGTFNFTNRIVGGGALVKEGSGVLILGRNAEGALYNGLNMNLVVDGGSVEIRDGRWNQNLFTANNTITIHNGGTLVTTATHAMGGPTVNPSMVIDAGGTWDMREEHYLNYGKLTLNGGTITGNASAADLRLNGSGVGRVTGETQSTIAIPVNLYASTTFDVASGAHLLFSSSVGQSGTQSFTKTGQGRVTFGGAANYSGTTTLTGGSIYFSHTASPATTALQMSSGSYVDLSQGGSNFGTLTLSSATVVSKAGRTGTASTDINGSVVLSNHELDIGEKSTVETLTISRGLTLNTAKLNLTLGSNSNDQVRVGTLNVSNATLYISSMDGVFREGTYDLIVQNDGVLSGDPNTLFTLQGVPTLRAGSSAEVVFDSTGKKVQLVIVGGNHRLVWQGSPENGESWDTQPLNLIWRDTTNSPAVPSIYYNGDLVVFNDQGGGVGTSATVNIAQVVTPSRVRVEGSKNYTINASSTGYISGDGGLTKTGASVLTLNGAHDFTGSVELLGGTVELTGATLLGNNGVASSLGAGSGAGNLILDSVTLRFNGTAATTTNRAFTLGVGGATLEAASTAANTLVFFNGTGLLQHTGTGDRTLTLSGEGGAAAGGFPNATPNTTSGGALSLSLTDPSGGKLRVVKNGGGTWVLQGNSTYTGGVAINAGMLAINNDAALGAVPSNFEANNVTINGGSLFNASSTGGNVFATPGAAIVLHANRGVYLGALGAGFRVGFSQNLTINGAISGPGSLTKWDGAALILNGVNTFNGGIVLNAGTIQVGNSEAIPHGTSKGNVTLLGTLSLMGVDAHVNAFGDGSTGVVSNGTSATTSILHVGETNATSTFAGTLANGSGTLGLTKLGTGTLTLSLAGAASTYSGPVRVEGGVLRTATLYSVGAATDFTVLDGASLDLFGQNLAGSKVVRIIGEGVEIGGLGTNTARSGALSNTSDAASSSVSNVILTGSAKIGTARGFWLSQVSGVGDLTLSAIVMDETVTYPDTGFNLETGGSLVLTPVDGVSTGRLNVETMFRVTGGDGMVNAPGGIYVTGGNLTLTAQNSGVTNIVTRTNPVRLDGGTLTLVGATTQILEDFGNTSGSGLVTHDGSTEQGVLVLDISGSGAYSGRIGSTTGGGEDTAGLNLIKRGSGTFTLSNGTNDYIGVTRIEGGVLNLLAPLSSAGTPAQGVLGSSLDTSALRLVIDGGTLRDSSSELSQTLRLFTIGTGSATIESSGTGSGLQFVGNGAVAFDLNVASDVTLTLGGTKAVTASSAAANIFGLALQDSSAGKLHLRKTGTGTWVITGANGYTGSTLVEAGTLALGRNQALPYNTQVVLGTGSTSGVLQLNGYSQTLENLQASSLGTANRVINGTATQEGQPHATLTLDINGNSTYSGSLGDAGNLNQNTNTFGFAKEGVGTLTLSGAAVHTGDTEVREGTLKLSGGVTSIASAFTFVDPGSLSVAPANRPVLDVSVLGAVGYSISAGQTLVAGNADTATDLIGNYRLNGGALWVGGSKTITGDGVTEVLDKVGTLTLNGTLYSENGRVSTLKYTFGPTPTDASDLLRANQVVLNGTTYVDALPVSYRLGEGAYALIQYDSFFADGLNRLQFSEDARYSVTFTNDTTAKIIYMNVESALDTNRLYWTGTNGTQWGDPESTGKNFYQAEAPGDHITSFAPGDWAFFDDRVTDANRRNIVVSHLGVELGAATFESSVNYTLASSGGAIGGAGFLEKYGTGTLTINNANTYTGGTYLGDGRLVVGHDSALGTGTLFLKGGILGSVGAHTLANAVSVDAASTIDTALGGVALTGALSGSGTLTKTGTGTLALSGNGSTYTGTIQHNAGTIALGSGTNHSQAAYVVEAGAVIAASFAGNGAVQLGSLAGAGTVQSAVAGAKTFVVGGRNNTTPTVFSGVIADGAGTVSLTKTGTGILVLGGANTYSGETRVSGGVLQVGTGTTTGQLGAGAIVIESAGTLSFNGVTNISLGQTITSSGVLEKRNGNTLILTSDNLNLGGQINILGGVLQVGNGGATGTLGSASVDNQGILAFNRAGDYTVANAFSGTGEIHKQDAGVLTYTGNNTGTGSTLVYAGTLALGDGIATTNQIYNSGKIQLVNSTLKLNPGAGTTLTLGGGVIGSGTLNKDGDGTAVLAGTTTLGGIININAGVLQVGNGGASGSLEGGAQVYVNTDTTLLFKRSGTTVLTGRITSDGKIRVEGGTDGTGTVVLAENNAIIGAVEVANQATLQIGNGTRTGSFNGTSGPVNVTLDAGARLAFNRIGTDVVTGSSLTLSGAGSFVKLGNGTVTFNSVGNHTGGTIVEAGRLIIATDNLPGAFTDPNGTGYLEAKGEGILELRNGTTAFALEGRIRGNGTIALGADGTVGSGTYSRYDYRASNSSAVLSTLEVGGRVNLDLGTSSATQVKVGKLSVLSGGLLTGQGTITGDLYNALGGGISPGNSVGQINIAGNFINTGNLVIELEWNGGVLVNDTIHYTGSAQLNSGSTVFFDISALGGVLPETGTEIKFLIDDDPADNPLGQSVIGSFVATNPELNGKAFAYNNGTGVSLLFAESVADIPGLSLHDGLEGFVGYLDGILANASSNPDPANTLGALLGSSDQSTTLNNASPLGLASTTAMSIASAHDAASTLRSHLESLRYDRANWGRDVEMAPYFTGTGLFATNGTGAGDPMFDFNTYGGLIGIDHSFSRELILGVNAGYSKGKADIHNGGGKVNLDSARFSIYGTYMVSDWVYVDAQAFGGYNAYDVKHTTSLGTAKAEPNGYDGGLNAYVGGIVPLSDRVHFTPYVGLEYVHSTVDGFTENGTAAALAIDSFSQDSLRAKIGTGFNWLVPTGADFSLRLGLQAAYAYEVLDTEADITGRFANDTSGRRFTVNAASTPEHSLQVGPVVELGLDGNKSFSLSYTFEHDLEEQTIHHFNATFRMRF